MFCVLKLRPYYRDISCQMLIRSALAFEAVAPAASKLSTAPIFGYLAPFQGPQSPQPRPGSPEGSMPSRAYQSRLAKSLWELYRPNPIVTRARRRLARLVEWIQSVIVERLAKSELDGRCELELIFHCLMLPEPK